MTTINATNTTVYLNDNGGGNIYYQIGQTSGSWTPIFAFPIVFVNTNPTYSSILTVSANNDLTFTNNTYYFVCGSHYITFNNAANATNSENNNNIYKINITNVIGYMGLIQNSDYTGITINNIIVVSNNSALAENAGWICQQYFGSNQTAINSSITNCYSDGVINRYSGGIVGSFAQYFTISLCWSTGAIEQFSGGIMGAHCSNINAINCYSIGIIGSYGGGIYGSNCSNVNASQCYSIGNIGIYAGGIFGATSSNCNASNCYSIGNISASGGGIYGNNYSVSNAQYCYTSGFLDSDSAGGILSGVHDYDPPTCYSEGTNANTGVWNDANAMPILITGGSGGDTIWISMQANNPYILYGFNYNFYDGDTTTSVVYGSGNETNLTITGTGSMFSFIFASGISPYPGLTINESSGQMTSSYYNGINNYSLTLIIFNGSLVSSSPAIYSNYNIITFSLQVTNAQCYLEGTKILCLINNIETYTNIEDITPNTLIKIYKSSTEIPQYKKLLYKSNHKINKITTQNYNNITQTSNKFNQLYVIKKSLEYPELFEDLYITGGHSILVDKLPQQIEQLFLHSCKYLPCLENKYLLPAFANDKCNLVICNSNNTVNNSNSLSYNVYHLVLESDKYDEQFAIWANGILSETLTIECYKRDYIK